MHEAEMKAHVLSCRASTVWLAVKTTENMALLNVDYIVWIVTVL